MPRRNNHGRAQVPPKSRLYVPLHLRAPKPDDEVQRVLEDEARLKLEEREQRTIEELSVNPQLRHYLMAAEALEKASS